MTANSDDELEAFFGEVEKLSIGHGGAADDTQNGKGEATDGVVGQEEVTNFPPTKKSQAEKKERMASAKDGQRAWSEFQKLDLSSSSGARADGKAKISFQIKSAKDQKKKKGKKKPPKKEAEGGTSAKENGSSASTAESDGACPRWTLVVDTCALLHDNGREVQMLIDVARCSARAKNRERGASIAAASDEPIGVVIPFKVWGELDYQSKSEDANNAYAARMAIRMLKDEMESGGIHAGGEKMNALRSQSLSGSREAADKYLSVDRTTTNDDYILACALIENEDFEGSALAAGGVVVLTLDNNLACKALANGLKANSPSEFREYYEKRMESLRQRAAGTLANIVPL